MDTIRVGIIGIGNMGSAHASCVASGKIVGMELVAVCDPIPARQEYCQKTFPQAKVYSDYPSLLQDETVDAVIIAVPHPLHSEIASAALKAGKHVLLEKPVDIAVTKAKQLNKIAEESGKVFGIMFNQRTNDLFQRAREIIRGGQLGELKRSVWIITNWYRTQHYYDSGSWRATWAGEGGGVLLNQAPHNLDLWQWICGMPCEVTGFCDVAKYHNIEVEDDVTIFVRYPNGATGTFITSTGEAPGTNRLEITGTLGKIILENGLLKWWKLKSPEPQVRVESQKNFEIIPSDYEEIKPRFEEPAHAGILQNFTNAILHGEELLAPGIEGINELTISNAAYLSSWNGSRPVKLPLDCEAFDKKLAELAANSSLKDAKVSDKYNTAYSKRWQINW